MSQISLINVSLFYGVQPLLDNVCLSIEERERICIVGRNGMGKSTLLKLINDEIKFDSGKINKQQHVIIARLDQDVPKEITGTIYEVIASGIADIGQLLARYQQLTTQVNSDSNPILLQELQEVQKTLDFHHAWDISHKIENIISKLNLSPNQQFSGLSGGMKRRVLLGKILVKEPTILLLDEPTNHLDIEAIEWLETFLKEFSGTVIFITHDRSFLQKTATRIVEIDRGNVKSFPGNYEQYLLRKQQDLEAEEVQNKLFDKKLKEEEVWLRQGVKARRTRNEGRVRALKKLRHERTLRRDLLGKANIQIQKSELSGKSVIEALNVHHSFKDRVIIKNFSTQIMRGDKIGIIGPNGIGKTTLLKILLGELKPDQGAIHHGTKLEVAYFDQMRAQLDEEKSVADNISYGDQFVTINGKSVHIIGYLQDFLFTPDRARIPVKVLSGGERNRLLLARLFTKPANVLVMDEPTNDLDIETLELLEELLLNYEGTLLLVSHDRSFLNNIVTSTIVFGEQGDVEEYVGGYDDYLSQRSVLVIPTPEIKPKNKVAKSSKDDFQRKKEIRAVEQKIEKLENQKKILLDKLGNANLYHDSTEANNLLNLQNNLKDLEIELNELLATWERLMED